MSSGFCRGEGFWDFTHSRLPIFLLWRPRVAVGEGLDFSGLESDLSISLSAGPSTHLCSIHFPARPLILWL